MIKPDCWYRPSDDALRPIASYNGLAVWRMKGLGPPYHKAGASVLYKGSDLLAWLESSRVETAA